jgi:hypothetical protein
MKKKKKKKGKGGGARWVISIREEVRLYEPLPLASIENLIRFFFFFFKSSRGHGPLAYECIRH